MPMFHGMALLFAIHHLAPTSMFLLCWPCHTDDP